VYFGKKKLLMIISIINMYLKEYSWKDLEKLRDDIARKLVEM
jgi:hypothetical protein